MPPIVYSNSPLVLQPTACKSGLLCSAEQKNDNEAYTAYRVSIVLCHFFCRAGCRTETMARSPVLNRHSKISARSSTTKLVFRLNNIDLSMVYTFSMLLLMVRHTIIDNSQVLDFEATRFSAAPCLISMTNTCPALVIDSLSLRYMTRASPPTDWGDIRKRPTSYFIICGLRSS